MRSFIQQYCGFCLLIFSSFLPISAIQVPYEGAQAIALNPEEFEELTTRPDAVRAQIRVDYYGEHLIDFKWGAWYDLGDLLPRSGYVWLSPMTDEEISRYPYFRTYIIGEYSQRVYTSKITHWIISEADHIAYPVMECVPEIYHRGN